MATFEEHCKETKEKLGHRFEEVHKYLDELAPFFGPAHRAVRHNAKGVSYCQKTWGDLAAHAAQIHIDRDLNSHVLEGGLWIPKEKK